MIVRTRDTIKASIREISTLTTRGVGPQLRGASLCPNALVFCFHGHDCTWSNELRIGHRQDGFRRQRKLGVRGFRFVRKDDMAAVDIVARLPRKFETDIFCLDGLSTPTTYFAFSCAAHSQRMHEVEVDVHTDPLIDFSIFEHQHWQQQPKFKPSTESQYYSFLVFVPHPRNVATGGPRPHCSLPPFGF